MISPGINLVNYRNVGRNSGDLDFEVTLARTEVHTVDLVATDPILLNMRCIEHIIALVATPLLPSVLLVFSSQKAK